LAVERLTSRYLPFITIQVEPQRQVDKMLA
jgi:hypothetical protein